MVQGRAVAVARLRRAAVGAQVGRSRLKNLDGRLAFHVCNTPRMAHAHAACGGAAARACEPICDLCDLCDAVYPGFCKRHCKIVYVHAAPGAAPRSPCPCPRSRAPHRHRRHLWSLLRGLGHQPDPTQRLRSHSAHARRLHDRTQLKQHRPQHAHKHEKAHPDEHATRAIAALRQLLAS